MAQTVAKLKSAIEENQAKSENHAQILQQEFLNRKMVSRESMSELLKDFNRVEARTVLLESEKSEIMDKFQECRLDLRRTNDENVTLKLTNTELMYKYEKLCAKTSDIEHNFDVLLKEKSAIENNLKRVQRERDEMHKKIQKYQARLKDKSYINAEQMSSLQKEQRTSDTRLNERKAKLQSLNHEFSINKYALEKGLEKCYDHVSMLNDVSRLVTLVTGQRFVVTEAQTPWQTTEYYLCHTIAQYEEDYSKLAALLGSDEQIENLTDIQLPALNIVFPQLPSLIELYYNEKAKYIHQVSGLPNPWAIQETHQQDPHRFLPATGGFRVHPSLELRINDTRHIPAGSVYCNTHFSRNSHFNDNVDNTGQGSGNDGTNGAEFQEERATVQARPIIIADTEPISQQTRNFDNRILHEDSLPYNAKKDDVGVLQASDGTTAVGTNPFEGAPEIPINRRATPAMKIGRELLMRELRKTFVGVSELDLMKSIRDVRKLHSDTMSGMRLKDIIRESEQFIKQRQEKHMAYYLPPKQSLPSEGPHPQPSKPDQQKLPLSAALTDLSSEVPPAVTGAIKKPARGTITSGLVEWIKHGEYSECTICYDNMNANDRRAPVHILPCRHSFHTRCIKKWLRENSVCPICRIHCIMDDEVPPLPF